MKAVVPLILVAALAAGCATVSDTDPATAVASDPLLAAFSTRIETLESQAQGGNPTAQLALSIVRAEGLRGVAPDPEAAGEWRRRALAAGAPTAITQYIPGINGAPGRTALIMVPGRGLSAAGIRRVDDCVAILNARSSDAAAFFPDFSLYDDPAALALHEKARSEASRTCGGDERYGLLSNLWDRGRRWGGRPLPDCEAEDRRCRVLGEKIARLNGRDPAAEARAAVARGDVRLGGFNHIGPMPQGWSLPGVKCSRWTYDRIGKWHVNQDVVRPGDARHTSASVAFIAAYNRAVVTDPAFPWPDVCAETLIDPLDHYPGTVGDWSQAARSGDPARIVDVPAGLDVNARDALGLTALDWAMRRGDEPMALALLDAGADPALFDPDEAPPLALALSQKRLTLARRMIDRGARMAGDPGVCDHRAVFLSGPPDRSRNNGCSWAGLLIKAEAFDLLDAQAAAGALDPPPVQDFDPDSPRGSGNAVVAIDPFGEIQAAFFAALAAGDDATARRLLPHVGHGTDAAGGALDTLYKTGRKDLVSEYVLARGARAARSEAEAGVWRAAASGGQADAVAFLRDFGADLNLLTPERLASCAASARTGDVAALLTCAGEAGERRLQLTAAIRSGDTTTFRMLVDQAADLNERGKATLLSVAADLGSTDMVQTLLDRGARVDGFYSTYRTGPLYDGPLKNRADAVAATIDYAANDRLGAPPALRAAEREEARMLRLLVDSGAPNLSGLLQSAGNLGNPPPGMRDTLFERDRSIDNESLPNRAPDRNFAAFTLLAAETARVQGPQALERAFASAAYSGYNDAMEALIAAGLDLSQVRNPQRIWMNWSLLGTPCKPSTGRILIRHGLRADYPPSRETRWPPLHGLSAGCADARSAEVLVREGGMAVNQIDVDGDTPLDVARRYQKTATIATLQGLGGLPASQAAPTDHAARQSRSRVENDLDLYQGDESAD